VRAHATARHEKKVMMHDALHGVLFFICLRSFRRNKAALTVQSSE
jgi:hypothetical protein